MNRRDHVPFDPRHYEQRAAAGERLSPADTFAEIFRRTHWQGATSVSGEGAGLEQTARIRAALPGLLEAYGVQVFLDLPCGDFNWMRMVELPVRRYIGGDIVPELVAANRERYGREDRDFRVLDLIDGPLPSADLILCRDALVHFSFDDVWRSTRTMRAAGIAYLLTTTFPETELNEDITTGDWRPINLERAPFHFPPPLYLLNEGCTESGGRFADKSLGLWRVEDVPEER